MGLAIILLTIVVRLILFVPNQKAMASQRELQRLQPKMTELKEKHKDNQQLLAMKTMELYKTHKINPMSSCWPILLQMPFLIGLYYIILAGLSPHMTYFLYSFQKDADLTAVDNLFLGLDLTVPNIIPLAIMVGAAQWFALRLANMRMKKKNEKNPVKKAPLQNQMAGQMHTMRNDGGCNAVYL
ncbi:UNVERIFIED_CONTAM: hypothetical protein GTU68_031534 [Idotea baltica]|nr:hypothetical protein [Idotea baltica]